MMWFQGGRRPGANCTRRSYERDVSDNRHAGLRLGLGVSPHEKLATKNRLFVSAEQVWRADFCQIRGVAAASLHPLSLEVSCPAPTVSVWI